MGRDGEAHGYMLLAAVPDADEDVTVARGNHRGPDHNSASSRPEGGFVWVVRHIPSDGGEWRRGHPKKLSGGKIAGMLPSGSANKEWRGVDTGGERSDDKSMDLRGLGRS
jgi:hypothetical protein